MMKYSWKQIDPGDFIGEPGRSRDRGSWLTRRVPARYAIPAVVAPALLLISLYNSAWPSRSNHHISDVQIFEGPDSVVLFVQVSRSMPRSGGVPPLIETDELIRVEISSEGTVKRSVLRDEDDLSFNTNISAIMRFGGVFYHIRDLGSGNRFLQLHRLHEDRIEKLSLADSERLLRSAGFAAEWQGFGECVEEDRISGREGWNRLNQSSYMPLGFEAVDSPRHGMRFRLIKDEAYQVIREEHVVKDQHGSAALWWVDTHGG